MAGVSSIRSFSGRADHSFVIIVHLKNRMSWSLHIFSILVFWMTIMSLPEAQSYEADTINWTPLRFLQFETGDLISCKLAGKVPALGSIYAPGLEHWLLAYDHQNLVDIEPNASLTETLVAIKRVDTIDHYRECFKHKNEKLAPDLIKDMVDVVAGRTLYYNLLRCNCKHYVHYWATGRQGGAMGQISFLPPSRKCVYVLEVNTPPFFNRQTAIPAIPPQDQPQILQLYYQYQNLPQLSKLTQEL